MKGAMIIIIVHVLSIMLNFHNNIIADYNCVYGCIWCHRLSMSFPFIVLCISVILSEICGRPGNISKHCRLIRTET